MRALRYEAPRLMQVRELDRPVPAAGEVLVEVAFSGICGSELSGFLGQSSLRTPPLVFGHEFSGHVLTLGAGVPPHWLGAPVTANPLVTCGHCPACSGGNQQLCQARSLLGAGRPGSNAELVAVPAACLEPVPEGLDLRAASMAEPAACAVHAVALSKAGPADTALVVGAGPIGVFLIQVLRAHGVGRIYASDTNRRRCEQAEAAGAVVVPAVSADLLGALESRVDLTFDAAGTEQTRQICVSATAPGGSVMLVGLHTDETRLPVNTVIRNEISLHGVFAYPAQAFRTALRWLAEGRIGLTDGVVEADLEQGPAWFERLVDGDPALKVLLRPGRRQTR